MVGLSATPDLVKPVVILMPQTAKKQPEFQDLNALMERSKLDINDAIRRLPRSSLSFRVQAIYGMALHAIAQETGLTLSEAAERLLCSAINEALEAKRLPPFEDHGPIGFGPVALSEGAA